MSELFSRILTSIVLIVIFAVGLEVGAWAYVSIILGCYAWIMWRELPPLISFISAPWRKLLFALCYPTIPSLMLIHSYVAYYHIDPLLVIYPFAASWVYDSSAYFIGKYFGRIPLVPTISPRKTIEGLIGGFVAEIFFHLVISFSGPCPEYLSVIAAYPIISGCVIALAATLGDLFVSALKRRAGIKDTGFILPGHGGLLDRADSIFFVLICVYWVEFVLLSGH